MWTLVKWLPWQQRLERLGSSSGVGRGRGAWTRPRWVRGEARREVRPRDAGPPPRPHLETPSHSGPQKAGSAQGQHHVATGDRCLPPRHPHTPTCRLTQPCTSVTNPHTLSPPGQAVTDTLSHWLTHTAAGNWGAVGTPSLWPPPPSKELSGPGCPGGQGDPGAGSICRKHGYLQCFIFKPSFSQPVAAVGRGWVELSLEPPLHLVWPMGCRGLWSPQGTDTCRETEARGGAGHTWPLWLLGAC